MSNEAVSEEQVLLFVRDTLTDRPGDGQTTYPRLFSLVLDYTYVAVPLDICDPRVWIGFRGSPLMAGSRPFTT